MKLDVKVTIVMDPQESTILNGILDAAQQAGCIENDKRRKLVETLRMMDHAADRVLGAAEEVNGS